MKSQIVNSPIFKTVQRYKDIGTQFPETASCKNGQWSRPHWPEPMCPTD
jgi:hypothetical protein